jgi:hypothetical protein
MSPAFSMGVTDHLPSARITFENFYGIARAWTGVDTMHVLSGVVKTSGEITELNGVIFPPTQNVVFRST